MGKFVPLSIPNFEGNEKTYVDDALEQGWVSTGGAYITKLEQQLALCEQYGVTLVTYLQQVRITHAKRMLRFTDKSIEEIGLECGIGELNYFSRVFKKLEGVSPSEFRRAW